MRNSMGARRLIFNIVKHWAKGWLWLVGMPLKKVGSAPPPGRYVVVANHISYLDTIDLFPAVPGYFRPLGKKEISSVPVLGFIYKQIAILVDRSDTQSRARSLRLLWRVLRREGNIFIFPEGTFNETPAPLKFFYDGAFRLAINTQTRILPMIFPDTVDRWHYSAWWKLWPGTNRVIYLQPVDVTNYTHDDLPLLKQKVYDMMEEALRAAVASRKS
jgi:1-acyl-sn-glycerol-3-phosphate acyltransferase